MSENIPQNLDLAQILATLASLPKPEAQPGQDQQQPYESSHSNQGYQNIQQQYPPEQVNPHQQSADPRLAGRPAPQHRHPAPKPQDRVSTPLIDPSTITEWKQGLRCVSKIAARNPEFAPAIRKVVYDLQLYIVAMLTNTSVDERSRISCQVMGGWPQKPHRGTEVQAGE